MDLEKFVNDAVQAKVQALEAELNSAKRLIDMQKQTITSLENKLREVVVDRAELKEVMRSIQERFNDEQWRWTLDEPERSEEF